MDNQLLLIKFIKVYSIYYHLMKTQSIIIYNEFNRFMESAKDEINGATDSEVMELMRSYILYGKIK